MLKQRVSPNASYNRLVVAVVAVVAVAAVVVVVAAEAVAHYLMM